jgi:hypothetical protein
MKKLAFCAVAMLVPALSQAVEMGIGASARSDDATIYLPINLNPGLRVEPFFSFGESETSSPTSTVSIESRELGVGVFARFEAADRIQPYFGGRLSYVETETTLSFTAPIVTSSTSDLDGFRLEPALGVEFFVTPNVAVGLEAFLFIESLDGTNAGASYEDESNGTGTRLLLRIMP